MVPVMASAPPALLLLLLLFFLLLLLLRAHRALLGLLPPQPHPLDVRTLKPKHPVVQPNASEKMQKYPEPNGASNPRPSKKKKEGEEEGGERGFIAPVMPPPSQLPIAP